MSLFVVAFGGLDLGLDLGLKDVISNLELKLYSDLCTRSFRCSRARWGGLRSLSERFLSPLEPAPLAPVALQSQIFQRPIVKCELPRLQGGLTLRVLLAGGASVDIAAEGLPFGWQHVAVTRASDTLHMRAGN